MEVSVVDQVYTNVYTKFMEVKPMDKAKIFTNGGSQAVRLPKSCRFETDEVIVSRIGDIVILMPENKRWSSLAAGMSMFTDDCFSQQIEDLPVQQREEI